MTKSQLRLIELMKHKINTVSHGKETDHWVPNESTLTDMPVADIHKIIMGWSNEAARLRKVIDDIGIELEALE